MVFANFPKSQPRTDLKNATEWNVMRSKWIEKNKEVKNAYWVERNLIKREHLPNSVYLCHLARVGLIEVSAFSLAIIKELLPLLSIEEYILRREESCLMMCKENAVTLIRPSPQRIYCSILQKERNLLMMTKDQTEDFNTADVGGVGSDREEQGWATKKKNIYCVIFTKREGILNMHRINSHYCTFYDI